MARKLREVARDTIGVKLEVRCEGEDIPVRGNAMASGDDAFDKEVEDDILRQLDDGNEWAWCCVHVIATFEGFKGHAYLGGVSCASEADFRASGDLEGMEGEALADLNRTIRETHGKLSALEVDP